MAGIGIADVDVLELYDAFSICPLILLEELGVCAPGMAGQYVESGATAPGGSMPMNTNGGLLSFGHTADAAGLSLLVEGTQQALGLAGARQVEGARTVLFTVSPE